MKVAFVNTPWSEPVLGVSLGDSIALWTEAVAQRLSPSCDVIIYGRRERVTGGTHLPVEQYGHIQFRRAWTQFDARYLNPLLLQGLGHRALVSPFYFGIFILQVALDLRKQRCDVVHIQCFPQFVPLIRRFNPRIKIVLHCHEEWLVQFDRATMERSIQCADLVLGCSRYLVQKFRQRFPAYGDRFQPAFNGVEAIEWCAVPSSAAPAPKQLLFVGRISPEKGIHVLLAAFERVVAQYPNVELKIVGMEIPLSREYLLAMSNEPQVQALTRFCGIPYGKTLRSQLSAAAVARIEWVGVVEHRKVMTYLRQADILINPSFYESFGNSIIEAMAMAVPVIVSRVGGMQETVVPEQTGLFFEAGDIEGLTQALLALLTDERRCRAMGQAGHQRVLKSYTWNRIVQRLYHRYQTLWGGVEEVYGKPAETEQETAVPASPGSVPPLSA